MRGKLKYIMAVALFVVVSLGTTVMAAPTYFTVDQKSSSMDSDDNALRMKSKVIIRIDGDTMAYYLKSDIEEGNPALGDTMSSWVAFDKGKMYMYVDTLGAWFVKYISDNNRFLVPAIDQEKKNPDKIKLVSSADEKLNNQDCVKKEYSIALNDTTGPITMTSKVWYTKSNNMPLRVENVFSAGKTKRETIDFSNWNVSPQGIADKVFTLPAEADAGRVI